MHIALLANWGLGLEILKAVHGLPDTSISFVVTRHTNNSNDIWDNAVYDFSRACGLTTLCEDAGTVDTIMMELEKSKTDLLLAHAFMKLLPRRVFSLPRYGSVNIHPSLLPKYRGPSPTYWVLKNREKETGLTSHYIDEGVDTGAIIAQRIIAVESTDSIAAIIEKQKKVVGALIAETLQKIRNDQFKPTPQDHARATYAPRPAPLCADE